MGVEENESGVLKLVHPGRFVETHKEPIRAAEVLKRNPRHSVTRPDFFEYPWIVVNPESLLKPGNVYFIVPNHTIYDLLKAHREGLHHFSLRQSQSSEVHHAHRQVQKRSSSRKVVAENTPNGVNKSRWLKQSLPIASCVRVISPEQRSQRRPGPYTNIKPCPRLMCRDSHQEFEERSTEESRIMSKSSYTAPYIGATYQEQDSGKRPTKQSTHEAPSKLTSKHGSVHLEPEAKLEDDSTAKIGVFHQKENHDIDCDTSAGFLNGDKEFKCRTEVGTIRPCLRKPDSIRKLLPLKVSFVLPEEAAES